jgi:hypothetical protein
MTAKDKAKELVKKFEALDGQLNYINYKHKSIFCALIVVDEIIISYNTKNLIYPKEVNFWNDVKKEIEKL